MINRKTALTALSLVAALNAVAQSDRLVGYGQPSLTIPGTSVVALAPRSPGGSRALTSPYVTTPLASSGRPTAPARTSQTPPTGVAPDTVYYGHEGRLPDESTSPDYPATPASYYHYGRLHQGLNLSLGMSVFAQFGKNARKGAGFTQSIAATYLQPLGKRAWLAVGGYVDHTNWDGDSYTTGGLYGELGYQLTDHWAAYVYGKKSIVNSGLQSMGYPYPGGYYGMGAPYMYNDLGDKLGAALRWTPNPSFSLEVSVEKNWYPSSSYGYPDKYKYNYPTPAR